LALPCGCHLPGERFDIVIDFSEHKGASLATTNDAPALYARGGQIVPSDVMLFKVTKPLARFDLPSGIVPKPGEEFRYVWHCHVLEHEDNEMMRPFDVVKG
jgi:FtsP/CotA-like multicopper oxidase with cupredoxin domain